MKIVYFVRHGLTEGNENNLFQTQTTNLSAKGVAQVKLLAKYFENIPIETIISSDMTRAVETASIIAKKIKTAIIETPLLREMSRPSIVRDKSRDNPTVKIIIEETDKHFYDPNWRHSDEENFFDLKDRCLEAIHFLEIQPENNILVVSHEDTIKMILSLIKSHKELTETAFRNMADFFIIQNASINKCQL